MKTIDIVTTHNVVIQYELASIANRGLAWLLDLVILVVGYFLITLIVVALIPTMSYGDMYDSGEILMLIVYLFLLPIFFYSFWCEAFFGGQTVGKMALGIKVTKVDGSNPSLGDYFLRWSLRLMDNIMTLGGLAALVAASTDKSQRFGDIVANTCVIKLTPSTTYSIKDILTIKNKENYEPKYSQVVQLTDEDMLLIKNAIDRARRNPNSHHKKLITELVERSCEKLNITEIPEKKVSFLKKLLEDYIVLTRS